MNFIYSRWSVAALLLLLTVPLYETTAQSYSHTSRPFLQDVSAVAAGDAGVALPSTYGGFFLNPAHTSIGAHEGLSVRAFGASIGATTDAPHQWDIFGEHLRPAIEQGYDNLSDDEQNEIIEAIGHSFREETVLSLGAVLPHLVYRRSGVALGVGMAAHSAGRYQVGNAGAGVPLVSGIARADLMGMGHLSANFASFNGPPLSAGITVKHTQRYATAKDKPLDAFRKEEDIYVVEGGSTSLDVGIIYELNMPWSGTFYTGAAVYDLARSSFDFTYSQNVTGRRKLDRVQKNKELAFISTQLEHSPSYRLGISQAWGSAQDPSLAISLDYLGYISPLKPQSHLAHLRLGVEARVLPFVRVQGGLNQGYPAAGVHLSAGVVQLKYSFYGIEQGRLPGQLPSWNHAAQMVFSW